MNHIYRLVWNKKRNMLVAVAENASAQGKEASGETTAGRGEQGGAPFAGALTLLAAAMCALFPLAASAQSGHEIQAGTAEYLFDGDGSNAAAAAWQLRNDGSLDIAGTDAGTSLLSLSGSGTVLLGERSLTLTAAQGYYAGTLQGSGGLALSGGYEVLGGANNYLGATAIADGATLLLAGSGSIATSQGVINQGVFDISASANGAQVRALSGSGAVMLGAQMLTLTHADGVFAGTIKGDGGFAIAGGNATLDGINTYGGETLVGVDGRLALSGSGSILLSSEVRNDGVFDLRAASAAPQLRSLSGSGTVLLGYQDLTLTQAGGNFAGVIQGDAGLTVAGGTEVLSGENTYYGATAVDAGATLALAGSGSIAYSSGLANNGVFDIGATSAGAEVRSLSGSGTVLLGGQTLTLADAYEVFDGAIHGSGGLAIAAGSATLSGTNTYTGATSIGANAWLSLAGSGSIALSDSVDNQGVFAIGDTVAGAQVKSLSGSGVVLLGEQTLTLSDAHGVFAGIIHGSGGLAVAGGTEVLSGANAYTGATVVARDATLVLSGSGSVALSSGVRADGILNLGAADSARLASLSGAGTVLLGANDLTLTGAAGTFGGAIHGSGGLLVTGGTQVLAGANTYAGATTIGAAGQLSLSGSGSIALSSGVVNDGVFDIAATAKGAQVRSISGSGAVLLGGQTLTLTDAHDTLAGAIHGSGGLAIAAGREVLSGANTYTGATAIARGAELALQGQGSIAGSRVAVDGTLDFTDADSASVRGLSGSGAVLLGAHDLVLSGAADTFAGTIAGSAGIAVSGGRETLAGVNAYEGATAIGRNGTLALSGSGSIALSSGVRNDGTLDIAASANGVEIKTLSGSGAVLLGAQTLTLSDAAGNFAGSIAGSGGLAIAAGTETLSGRNTYGGDTVIAQGATLALAGAGSIANSRVSGDGTLDVTAASNAAVKGLSGSGSVLLGGQTLTLTNAAGTYAGLIQGSGGLVIGGGTATLSGAQAYTGRTAISAGATLALSGSGSVALSSGVVADGRFDIARTDNGATIATLSGAGSVELGGKSLILTRANGTFSGTIAGAGGVTLAGGTETLSGRNTYSGDTDIGTGATLALSGNGSIANSRVSGNGILDISGSSGNATVKSLAGAGTVTLGGKTLTLANAGDAFSGRIAGAGGLALAGGVQTLTAAQAYTGATTIGAGATLALQGKGAIAASSGVIANGRLDLAAVTGGATIKSLAGSGAVILGSQNLTLSAAGDSFAGAIAGSGALAVAGGRQILAGANTYTGATTIAKGATLALSGSGGIAQSSGVAGDGTLDISASANGASIRNIGGSGSVVLGAQTLTLTQAGGSYAGTIGGAGGLAVAGGKATLLGANSYTGVTGIGRGATLALGGSGSVAASSAIDVAGTFDLAGAARDVSIKGLTGAGTVLLGTRELTVTQAGGRFDGVIAGNGGLTLTGGKLSLAGNNSFTGATVVRGATLQTVADANLGAGRAALQLDNGTWQTSADLVHARGLALSGRGTVDVDGGTTTYEDGAVTGSGALVKQGSGTLVLRGTLAQGGGLQVNAGTVALSAVNTYGGGTTVSSGGLLRIDGDANLGAAGTGLTLDGGTLQTTGTMRSGRAIDITARNGVVDTLGADSVVTLDGQIDGAGRIVKEGAGTLVLNGDNAGGKGAANVRGEGWTGGLTINAGLVKVTNAYGLGWGDVMTFNSGTIQATVDIATGQDIRMGRSTAIDTVAGTTTTLSGDMISTGAGDGCFTKTGLGTLNVTGAARIDATCVMEGKLLANGSFASRVTVARGATLGGAGAIQGDVLVRGTLSPGNSPGMLTADSNITMATGSTFKEDIGGAVQASAATPVGAAGYYSYLHVVGGKQFTIQPGSTLAPALKDLYTAGEAGYGAKPVVPELGQTYRIVTADGGILGRFDTLAQPDGMAANTRFAAFYNQGGNNSIELKVLPASYATWFKDGNANARAVAGALDRIADLDQAGKGSAVQTGLLYGAASSSAQKVGDLVQGLSGEVHGALAAALPQAGWELQRTILKQGAAADGRALWLDIGAGRAKWSDGDAASGFDADRVQVSAGLDLLRGNALRAGFGFSHAGTSVDAAGGDGKLRQNKVFAYGEAAASGLVFDGLASYGRDRTESHRADPFAPMARLGARADGHSALLGVGVRMPVKVDDAPFEPFARVTVQRVERDGFAEAASSPAALAVDGWSATGTRVVAGLAGSSRNLDPLQASTYRFNLGAGVDAGGLARLQQHATLAGTGIAIGAPDTGRAFVQGGATGTLQIRKGAYLYYGVTGEARSNYYTVGGNAGVRAVF